MLGNILAKIEDYAVLLTLCRGGSEDPVHKKGSLLPCKCVDHVVPVYREDRIACVLRKYNPKLVHKKVSLLTGCEDGSVLHVEYRGQ